MYSLHSTFQLSSTLIIAPLVFLIRLLEVTGLQFLSSSTSHLSHPLDLLEAFRMFCRTHHVNGDALNTERKSVTAWKDSSIPLRLSVKEASIMTATLLTSRLYLRPFRTNAGAPGTHDMNSIISGIPSARIFRDNPSYYDTKLADFTARINRGKYR